jgi:peroxiredoxin
MSGAHTRPAREGARARGAWRFGVRAAAAGCALAVSGGTAWAADAAFDGLAITHVSGGVQAPEFDLATADGKRVSLTALRGHVVLLNFWATWCPPCREEMPSMERLYQEFKTQGLAVLAVDIQESPKQVARFMRDFRLTFPALLDTDAAVAGRYGARGLPSTYLIDRNGRVVGQAVGPRDWSGPAAKALIRLLLETAGARP